MVNDLVLAVALLAIGTLALRAGGTELGTTRLASNLERWSEPAVVTLLASVAATAALYEGTHFSGWARIAGVGVGAFAVALRAPMLVVVLAATVVTALLRHIGVA
ncbi:AzlD domain-containing protein [Humidisolicoccus flavus]|uniref:AzlD domain-containing protein n=1 Tax=Humidisolicoccus flavus TaxID=3111414 RepID=UPI003253AE76